MKSQVQIQQGTANLSVRDKLARHGLTVAGAAQIFDKEIQAPLLRPCESLAYKGCLETFSAALKLLNKPNALALAVQAEMSALNETCAAIYKDNSQEDDYLRDNRALSAYPAWAALCAAGHYQTAELDVSECSGEMVAIGVNVGLAWVSKKKMATGHMRRINSSFERTRLTIDDLKNLLSANESEVKQYTSKIDWYKQFIDFFEVFKITFDESPDDPRPEKTFDEKARAEMGYRAAFATPSHRAGILDAHCLSMRQLEMLKKNDSFAPFHSLAAYRVATWLIEFSGLNTQTIKDIPIVIESPLEIVDDWAVKIELPVGLLLRDYSSLAKDAADPEDIESEPASFVFSLPVPKGVIQDINELLKDIPRSDEPITASTLIPELLSIQPQWSIYPSIDGFTPSWAKLNYTVGPLLIQEGMDSLLAGALVGNLGIPVKSKIFYVRVTPLEIWSAAAQAYQIRGWSDPVEMPQNLLAFGARVVPSTIFLAGVDKSNCKRLETLRSNLLFSKKDTRLDALLDLHNFYVSALAYRIMIRLALRSAAKFPLSASILNSNRATVSFYEKASAGRKGRISAIVTQEMRSDLDLYLKHCEALYERLKNMHFTGVSMQWLRDVISKRDVDLFSFIYLSGRIEPVSSKCVSEMVSPEKKMAKDFGRKWMENALRSMTYSQNSDAHSFTQTESADCHSFTLKTALNLRFCTTEDIDQVERHETMGREAVTTVSDSSEYEFVKRMSTVLDRATKPIFKEKIYGLRKK